MNEDIETHPLAGHFNSLSPDHVIGAIEVGGRRCTGRFMVLNSYENRVYQLELDDDSWVVGKFYRPGRWSRETILDEHRFLFALAAEEIPVACPVEIADGDTIGTIDGIMYTLFPRVAGRSPQEMNDEQLRMAGRLIARIHNIGARREAPHRKALTPATYGEDNLRFLLESGAVPLEARENYEGTVRILLSRIEPLFLEVPVHPIHGDCHLGNLVETRDGYTFLDFDDMVVGPAVQDVWMLVPSFDEYGRRQREVLLKAYEEFRRFDPAWLVLVEPLRALRFIHYSAWIARRWSDPVFPRTFPYFGTLQYWQKEIQDLREQIARMDERGYGYG